MKKLSFALALFVSTTVSSFAIDVPQPSKFDSRIQYVNYNDGDVVTIRALTGIGGRIVFDSSEEILDVASGFTQGWEFSDRRNILYIKPKSIKTGSGQDAATIAPKSGEWNTNLMVTTNRRLYDFDLKLLPGGDSSHNTPKNQPVAYRVEFRYPMDDLAKNKKEAARAATQAKLNQKAAPRNWAYSMQVGDDSKGIAPTMAYDDGRFTYLKFPNNRYFPAVFIVAANKTESIVNTHVENDILVVHKVSSELVLRLGNAVVGVYNDAYDEDGLPPKDGTTVPGVRRVIVGDLEK